MVIETCPKCGHDLTSLIINTYPSIPRKECWNCGWSWEGEPEKIVRVPFHENQGEIVNDDYTLTCNSDVTDVSGECCINRINVENITVQNLYDIDVNNIKFVKMY